jgi:hypothetical protein
MAASGLKIFLEVPGFANDAFYRLAYWSATGKVTLGLEHTTFLSGVFSIMIGTGPRPKNDYADQLYTISAVDEKTGTTRITTTLRIPTEDTWCSFCIRPASNVERVSCPGKLEIGDAAVGYRRTLGIR